MDLHQPNGLVKVIMWLPWCTLVLSSLLIVQLPWWGVLLVAGFGWLDFIKTTIVWVMIAFLMAHSGALSTVQFHLTLVCAFLVGVVALPGLILIKRAGLLASD
jgi:hypothetical protein